MEPHSLVRVTGEGGSVRLGPGLRPLRPMPHGPPTSLGGREKWSVDGRRKRESKRLLSAFSQRVPPHVPSPPSRWAGRYGPFAVRAAGQVSRQKYSLPPHNPTREGDPGVGTSSPGGSFPHFFPRNGAPAGQAPVPRRSNGVGETPQRAPLREPLSPPLQRREDILHPPSRQSPPAQTKNTAVPHRPRRCFFSARRKRLPQSPISRSRFTISTALRAQS